MFFRDDLEEETQTASIQLFQEILSPGGEIPAASSATAHLPSDLAIFIQRNS